MIPTSSFICRQREPVGTAYVVIDFAADCGILVLKLAPVL
jgi:hypothetical protein